MRRDFMKKYVNFQLRNEYCYLIKAQSISFLSL